jgi:hypothetical protein
MENSGMLYGHFVFLSPLGVFYGHWVNFVVIWYRFSHFSILYQEKSGNFGDI